MRCINDLKTRVVEGELRSKELMKYLDEHKTKKIVWISEDATAIISKIKYDPITNQLVGILLPINKNGNPIPFRYFYHFLFYKCDMRNMMFKHVFGYTF